MRGVDQVKIARFNDKHDVDVDSQFKQLNEDIGELAEALNRDADVFTVAEELADVIFVARSIAELYGINITDVVNNVAAANLEKDEAVDGDKVTKSGLEEKQDFCVDFVPPSHPSADEEDSFGSLSVDIREWDEVDELPDETRVLGDDQYDDVCVDLWNGSTWDATVWPDGFVDAADDDDWVTLGPFDTREEAIDATNEYLEQQGCSGSPSKSLDNLAENVIDDGGGWL